MTRGVETDKERAQTHQPCAVGQARDLAGVTWSGERLAFVDLVVATRSVGAPRSK